MAQEFFALENNHAEFVARLNGQINAVNQDAADLVGAAVVDTLSFLQQVSPIDLGTYRASHDLTLNRPSTLALKPPKRGNKNKQESAALRRINEGIARVETVQELTDGLTYYITNNLSYALPLEFRPQTPKAFYARAEVHLANLLGEVDSKFNAIQRNV